MKHLLGANDDWIEAVRKRLYPALHPYLQRFGGYGIGAVYENQYVATSSVDEEALELELQEAGFFRNPIAAYKTHKDGRKSEGSWRITPATDPTGKVEKGMQLHVTLFQSEYDASHIDMYAHYEKNWEADASGHLSEDGFSARKGVEIATEVLDGHMFVKTYQK